MGNLDHKHEVAADARQKRSGRALERLTFMATRVGPSGLELVGMSVRFPREDGEDFLVTLRALDEAGAPVVAFHGAATLEDAVMGVVNRIDNGSLSWRADQWGR